MADQEGLSIVLTPVQLAAVMQGSGISPEATFTNRLWGGLKTLGGALELVGGGALLLAPEPTMVTKVGGGALVVHGSDTTSTGLRQIWTGQPERTLTEQAATNVALALGADEQTAQNIGVAVDIAVPIVVAGAVGAARAASVRAGRLNLIEHEAMGGHTIARHVGRTEAQLRARLAQQTRIPAASTFKTLANAEEVVSAAIKANARQIQTWATTAAGPNRLAITYDAGKVIGEGVVRSTNALTQMRKINFVLEKTTQNGKLYYILTAYPIP